MGLFSRTVVGIDLGHASVKVVGATVSRHPQIVGCAEVAVDPKYLAKDGFSDPAIIGQAVREAMRAAAPHAIKTVEAYCTVSEGIVFRKILELPKTLTELELPQVVRTEAVEYLPDEIDNLELDYQPLGAISGDAQQVMVVAVPKKVIADYVAVLSAAKLHGMGIDPKPSAVARAIVAPQDVRPIILIDIGTQMTSISVYGNRMIWVTGTVNIGGDVLKDPSTGEIDEEKKVSRLERLTDGIGDELSHVLKFYQNRANQEQEIKEIRLCGGGSMIEGVVEQLQKQVKEAVVEAKPIIALPGDSDRRFLGALGSALYPLYEAV